MSVCLTLIGVTCVTSFLAFSRPRAILAFGESPWAIVHDGRWYQMITAGFLHADLGHLFVNMLTLFFFGPTLERILGGGAFLVIYVGSLVSGSLLTVLLHHEDRAYRSIGASGAVTGVVFGFVLFRPLAPIYIFFIPIGIPAALFAVVYLVGSAYGAHRRIGRIGHAAHLGGAIGGALLTIAIHPRVVAVFLSHFH